MSYTNNQIAKKLAELIKRNQVQSSYQNGVVTYGDQSFTLPSINGQIKNTNLTYR